MVKRFILCFVLASSLVLGGCANGGSLNQDSSQTPEAATAGSESLTTETASTENESEKSDMITTGGQPWIDSDLKANITEDMELSLKDDFHLYVNHDWLLKNNIEKGRNVIMSVTKLEDKIGKDTIAALEDESLKSHDAKLAQSFYKSFLDWDTRNKAGLEPIKKTVKDIQDIESIDDLRAFLTNPETDPFINGFISMGNVASLEDSSKYIVYIATTDWLLMDPAEYINRTEMGDKYYEGVLYTVKAMLQRLDYSEEEAQTMFDSVIDLETKLAQVSLTSADWMAPDHMQKINNHYKLDQMEDLSPSFPLKAKIENYGYGQAKDYMVTEPEMVSRLNELFTEDNLQAFKNYMLIHYVHDQASYLDQEAYNLKVKESNIESGSEGSEDDEIVAFRLVRDKLMVPLDKTFLEKYDSSKLKKQIIEICKEYVAAYRHILEDESWLTKETRDKAIEKLDNMKINAVYPDKWIDYSSLDLEGLSCIECLAAIKNFDYKLDVSRTNGKVDKDLWDMSTLEVNAYYSPDFNSVNILRGILEAPFYSEDMLKEEVLGGIGMVIGHEISHAFDSSGAQYDKDGNMENWWTEEDYDAFQKRADKLVSYYDKITAWEGQNIIGKNIQGEAIADMGGLKAALYIAKDSKDFDYAAMFEAFAALWSGLRTRESEYMQITQNPHPLFYLRTNATVQQYQEFMDTYGIKEGDNMYLAPEDRVNVW